MNKLRYVLVVCAVLFNLLAFSVSAQEPGDTVYVGEGFRLRSSPAIEDLNILRSVVGAEEAFTLIEIVEGEEISSGEISSTEWFRVMDVNGEELYVWSGATRWEPGEGTASDDHTDNESHAVHWSYEGEEGPNHWGDLSPEFEACSAGHAQSPIDITNATSVDLNELTFSYQASNLSIFNNGHAIQVNYAPGSTMTFNETTYTLLQFHLHHPSEHLFNGETADMEIHLVHKSESGQLAVVGVMMNAEDVGDVDYEVIFNNLPTEPGEPADVPGTTVNAALLLPDTQTFYTYEGSLTTPPCSEGVRWLVMTTPIEVTLDQVNSFAAIFPNNARPVQQLNTRDLLVDSQ